MRLSRPYAIGLALAIAACCLAPLIPPVFGLFLPHAAGEAAVGGRQLIADTTVRILATIAAVGLAAALWLAWNGLSQHPAMRPRLQRIQPGTSLAVSLAITSAALCFPAAFCLEFALDPAHSDHESALRAITQKAEPAWPELATLLADGIPDHVPAGHGRAMLETLAKSPYMESAFELSGDGSLHLLVRSPLNKPPFYFEERLDTWHPVLLNPFHFGRGAHVVGPPSQAALRREFFVQRVYEHASEMIHGDRARFEALPMHEGDDMPLFVTGNRKTGFVGFALSSYAFNADAQAVLKRHGLDDVVQVVFGQASLMAGGQAILPRAGVEPALAQAWLAPIGNAVGQFVDHVSGFELLIALLGFVIGLAGIAESLHQLRAFLAQRAIALAQSDFVSAVSHEMRTPLTTIKMYAEMVEQDVVTSPEKRSAYMRTIAKECDRLGRLVENVLDYARIGRGQRAYQLADTAIAPLVAEAVAALEGPLAQAGLTVEVAVAEGLRAQVDRDAIVQGLINLLGNAAKYAAEGGRVRVTAVHEGQAIVLAVQDFGPGIARTEHKKVFQPFYRIGSELTRTAAGTGLGLALVDAHARGHGGHVELVSTVGQGATFRLVLPQERTSA